MGCTSTATWSPSIWLAGFAGEGLYDIVRELYQYWKPGMEPAVFVEEAPAEVAAVSSGGEGGAGPSAYEQLVPEILRERSKAALAEVEGRQRLIPGRYRGGHLEAVSAACRVAVSWRPDVEWRETFRSVNGT